MAALVSQLHAITDELEALHPGRQFPIDGHLVGSLGEAAAAALFCLDLVPPGTAGYDAVALGPIRVEIKATYGVRGVGIRRTSHAAADALIVLKLSSDPQVPHEVVFNGPLSIALKGAGKLQSNGQAHIICPGCEPWISRSARPIESLAVRRGPLSGHPRGMRAFGLSATLHAIGKVDGRAHSTRLCPVRDRPRLCGVPPCEAARQSFPGSPQAATLCPLKGTRITSVFWSCRRATRRSLTYQAGRNSVPLRLSCGSDSAYRRTSSGVICEA